MVAQTELEELLDVFNVAKYKTNDKHILEYTGTSTNPKVKRLLRHLSQATEVHEIIERMKMEDEVENAFAAEKKQKEDMRHERDEAIRNADEANRKAEESVKEIEYLKQQLAAALKDK